MSRSAVESNTIPFIMQWGCSDIGTIEKHRGDRGMGSYASGSNHVERTTATTVTTTIGNNRRSVLVVSPLYHRKADSPFMPCEDT